MPVQVSIEAVDDTLKLPLFRVSANSRSNAMTKLKTVASKDVQVGDKLPELAIPLTATMIVAGAMASHDFTPVHHDKGAAQAQGMQDVFMNILTTNGLVGRYVTDWAGPNAVLKEGGDQAGAPNFPGDT